MKSFVRNKTSRRNFFALAGKGSLGAMVLSVLPFKLFASAPKYSKLKKIEIHKQAVKRNA
jgi:hypothetical protein